MQIGLFFGSFNPVHIGHLILANYMVEYTPMQEIWFVISPHNPLKKKESLLLDFHRYDMLEKAISSDTRFRICDVEFHMPKPSYTIDTLTYLSEKYPRFQFSLIMGSDGLPTFHKWKNHDLISQNYTRYVYPRPGIDAFTSENIKNTIIADAPMLDISSTFIRKAVKEGKDIRHFMPSKSWEYMRMMHFYE